MRKTASCFKLKRLCENGFRLEINAIFKNVTGMHYLDRNFGSIARFLTSIGPSAGCPF